MSRDEIPRCRSSSCNAVIRFVASAAKEGRRIPIDPRPTPEGNLRLEQRGDDRRTYGVVLTGLELDAARTAGEQLYLPHFKTCPDAAAFRRRR